MELEEFNNMDLLEENVKLSDKCILLTEKCVELQKQVNLQIKKNISLNRKYINYIQKTKKFIANLNLIPIKINKQEQQNE